MHTIFWLENLRERNDSGNLRVDGRIILEWKFGREDGKVWTGLIWLRIGASGRLL
jgi:hypothetical protein